MPPDVRGAAVDGECWGTATPDPLSQKSNEQHQAPSTTYFHGAIVVGAGPSGLATAACLQRRGVPSLILEKSAGLAALWQHNTYDRLHLHLPKQFCELPFFPFPAHLPTYPTRSQFVDYLADYARHFGLAPLLDHGVDATAFDRRAGLWRVQTSCGKAGSRCRREFRARWLVVATGENAEPVVPALKGMKEFRAAATGDGRDVFHSSQYRNGAEFAGKKVLVVGCGNSGMEIALDLANFGAAPSIVVRSPAHILPREIFGRSTYAVAMKLMKAFPRWLTDFLLVSYTYLTLGDTARFGIRRPADGPMCLKDKFGKTPILDVGTFAKIRSGHVKVVPAIEYLTANGAKFDDGRTADFEAVILATGYRSNVPQWLKDDGKFFAEDGLPRAPFPHGWKGDSGLYVAGLGRKGLLGASFDAQHIAADVAASFHVADIPSLRVVPASCHHHQEQQQQHT